MRGGRIYDGGIKHPLPGTPTVSLRLNQIIETKDGTLVTDVVEAVLTNTGSKAITIPIGDDPVPLLKSGEPNRRYFQFAVKLANAKRFIAVVTSASNSGQPESSAVLQPGDTALFWLPAGSWRAREESADQREPNPDVTVVLSLNEKVIDGGVDYNQMIGEEVPAQNSVPLPHAAGSVFVH
ncbi:MAG: hypothetical protein JO340_09170 [Acidobacteriaceae bacterium]|nr:hypothetical protein [Acidobacteriaceae bacterium]